MERWIDQRRRYRVRFALMIEPQQGLSYEEQLALARRAEAAGFETLFRSDHYQSFPGPAGRPTTDAWTVLAGLARETTRIRLGVLVSPVTFRHPGAFAKVVTTVDEMSGGRVDVGVGAGWNEVEHAGLGLPFPPIEERVGRLEEELAILHGLWGEPDGWSFQGRWTRIEDARFHPRPIQQPRPPIVLGGEGSARSRALAARWADEYNLSKSRPAEAATVFRRLDEACAAIGREPASLRRSVMIGALIGRDRAELEQRVADQLAVLEQPAAEAEAWLAERRPRWMVGTPDEARERAREFAAIGVDRLMLQVLLPRDAAMLDLLAEALIGRV